MWWRATLGSLRVRGEVAAREVQHPVGEEQQVQVAFQFRHPRRPHVREGREAHLKALLVLRAPEPELLVQDVVDVLLVVATREVGGRAALDGGVHLARVLSEPPLPGVIQQPIDEVSEAACSSLEVVVTSVPSFSTGFR